MAEKLNEERTAAALARTPEEMERRLTEIARKCHALPSLDGRTPDEIIGYDDYGLPYL